jgi:hypothetical protein
MNPEAFLKHAVFEFKKLKQQAERALDQVSPEDFFKALDEESNSLAILMKHLSGNMRSRWTNFLTTDGEKPDRNRDTEFIIDAGDTPDALRRRWEATWKLVFEGLESLRPEDLEKSVVIRGESQSVPEAILRQLTHYSSHVGQMVFLAKHLAGKRWNTLSVPRGKSEEYNARMRKLVEGYRGGKV